MPDYDKHRLIHRLHGSRVLDQQDAEALAYLLADGVSEDQALTTLEMTGERLQAIQSDDIFQRRLAFLSNKKNRVKKPRPRDAQGLADWALGRLYYLAKHGESKDRVRVDAAARLASAAANLIPKRVVEEPDMPVVDTTELRKTFEEEEK